MREENRTQAKAADAGKRLEIQIKCEKKKGIRL